MYIEIDLLLPADKEIQHQVESGDCASDGEEDEGADDGDAGDEVLLEIESGGDDVVAEVGGTGDVENEKT